MTAAGSANLVLAIALAARCFAAEQPPPANEQAQPSDEQDGQGEPAKKTIVIFDFQSQGDDNKLGAWVAQNVRSRTLRKGLYVLIEEMDVAAALEQAEFAPSFDKPLTEVAKFARERLHCDLAMCGKVDRPKGDQLAISVRVITASENPDIILEGIFTAESQHVTADAVNELLRQLAGEDKPASGPNPAWDKAWEANPNLVRNPGFEDGANSPEHWDEWGRDYEHGMVHWVEAPNPDGHGKCIKFDMNAEIAGVNGVAYYSEEIDTSQGTRYRASVRVRTEAPTVKIFFKHYAWFPPLGNEKEGQWRETRRAQINCHGANKEWKTFTQDFHPRRNDAQDPKRTKVELYAYWPPGVVYFDDVVVKRIE